MSKRQAKNLAEKLGKRNAFDSLQQETFLNLVRTNVKLSGDFSRLFKQHGLTDSKYNALRILRGEGAPMQVYQIAERMVTPQTDVTRLVDRLETVGLVQRARCDQDRRVVWVQITPEGLAKLKKLDKPVADLHAAQFVGLSKTELKQLNDLLFRAGQA